MEKTQKRRVELIVTIVLIFVALVVFGLRVYSFNKAEQEKSLIAELQAVRISVQLFLTMNKSFPENLQILTTTKYTLGNKQRLYLTGIQVDNENYPIDSFGNRFTYDPQTGMVNAGTKGYEAW